MIIYRDIVEFIIHYCFIPNVFILIEKENYENERPRNIILLRLAVVAMAGLAAEGLKYDKVVGQSADLFTLQVCMCHLEEGLHNCRTLILIHCLVSSSEIYKQEQAAAEQRPAAKLNQMGSKFLI